MSAVAAFACGSLPFLSGLFGIVYPRSKALIVISTITSTIAAASVIVIYKFLIALYGQMHTPIVEVGMGTYMIGIIVAIETGAGFTALRQKVAPLHT